VPVVMFRYNHTDAIHAQYLDNSQNQYKLCGQCDVFVKCVNNAT